MSENKKKRSNGKKTFAAGGLLLIVFAVWTVLIQSTDVQPIGPNGSYVGFAGLNQGIHKLTGVHMILYTVTDWLGLVPIACVLGFAVLGLVQWIKRKRFLAVDSSIFVLGGFYIVVMAVFVLFEYVVINRRPVLIAGVLEASYPSSTTMLVMCVMPTAMMQLRSRIQNEWLGRIVSISIIAFMVFMVGGRLLSGVHWITDIIGGALFSVGFVVLYCSFQMKTPET